MNCSGLLVLYLGKMHLYSTAAERLTNTLIAICKATSPSRSQNATETQKCSERHRLTTLTKERNKAIKIHPIAIQ